MIKEVFRMKCSQHYSAHRFALGTILLCFLVAPSYGFLERQSSKIELTDNDRAAIIQSVLRKIFNPKSNYEGRHFIFAEGIRSEWIPKISGYNLVLVTREEINAFEEPPHYYVIQLEPTAKSVEVIVNLYDREDERYPEVNLHYSYRRINGNWRGEYLYGSGN
jgi:hypothetical protein